MHDLVMHVLGLCPDSGSHVSVFHVLAGGAAALGTSWCWVCASIRRWGRGVRPGE